MAVGFRAMGAVVTTAAAVTLSPVVPAAALVGDLLIATVGIRSSAAQTWTKPAGWTEYTANSTAGTTCALRHFWKFAASGDFGAGPALGWTSSVAAAAAIAVYTGADPTSPLSTLGAVGASTTTTVAYGTATVPINCLVQGWGTINKAGTMGTPTGWTNRLNNVTNQGLTLSELAFEAGSTGAITSTYTTAANNCGDLLLIVPAQNPQIRSFVDEVSISTAATSSTPAATQLGDLNLAFVKISTASTITTPTGWTQVYNTTFNTAANQVACYQKIATAAGAESPTWTFTGAGTAIILHVCVTGVDPTNPIDVSGSQNNASSTTVTSPSVVETANNDLLLFYGAATGTKTWTVPVGLTSISSTATKNTYAAFENESTAVTTSTLGAQIGVAGVNFGAAVVVKATAAPKLRQVVRSTASAATSMTANMPTLVSNGDLLVMVVAFASTVGALTTPTGWTLLDHYTIDSPHSFTLIRTAASEPGSYSLAWTSAADNVDAHIASVGSPAFYDVMASGNSGAGFSTSVAWPTVTTSRSAELLLFFQANAAGVAVTTTQPVGVVEVLDDSSTTSDGSSVGWEMAGTAGATGGRTGTLSTTARNMGVTFAVTSAAAPIVTRPPVAVFGRQAVPRASYY